jgi:hypothetical protein
MIRIPDTQNPYTRRQMKIAIPCCQYFSNLSIVSFLVCCLQGHVIDSNHGSWFSNLQGWDQIVQHWPHTVAHVLVNTVPVDMARGWKGSNMFEKSWLSQNEEYHGLPENGNSWGTQYSMHSNQQIVQTFSEPKWQPHDHGIWRGLFELITVTTVTTARLDLMASNCWWSFQLSAAVAGPEPSGSMRLRQDFECWRSTPNLCF